MNIYIYCNVQLWQAHHAEALEIALKHLANNDQVFMGHCDGDLTSCPANATHSLNKCLQCQNNSSYALDITLGKKVVPVRLQLSQMVPGDVQDSLLAFKDFNQLIRYRENDIPWGSLIASQLVDDLQDCFADLTPFKQKISSMLKNGKALYLATRKLIADHSIDKVYFWNGRRISDGPVYYAARDEHIHSEAYISGGKASTYMTIAAPTVMDLYENKRRIQEIVVNHNTPQKIAYLSAEARDFFYTQRYGGAFFPGSVTFSKTFQPNQIVPAPLTESRKTLVLFSSSYWEFLAIETFAGGVYPDHYLGIKKILAEERIATKYLLVIRWHPNLRNCGRAERKIIDEISQLANLKGAITYAPESEVDSYALLEKAHVVVTFGSTIGAEASYYGKPTILLGRSWYEDLALCYTPKTHEDFILLLNRDLPPLSITGAVVYGYYMRNFGNNLFKYLTLDSGYKFRYEGQQIHPKRYISEIKSKLSKKSKIIMRSVKKLLLKNF